MAQEIILPALSRDGWVTNSIQATDYLLSHFFLSDYSQDIDLLTEVASFPWILHETQDSVLQTLELTRTTLTKYFSRYFKDVVVETTEVENKESPSKAQISIYISFTDREGIMLSIGKLVRYSDLKVEKIIDLNNGSITDLEAYQ